MNEKINIYLVDVTVKFIRNRKVTVKTYKNQVTKGNEFETQKRFLRLRRFCPDFKEGIDTIVSIEIVKNVGSTTVIDN